MSTEALPLSAFALENCLPPPAARTAGQTLTVPLRLGQGGARREPMAGTLVFGPDLATPAASFRAAVVDAPGNSLTVTL